MRIDLKSLLPLVVGGLLLAAALAGFVITRTGDRQARQAPRPRPEQPRPEPAPAAPPAPVVEVPPELTPEEIEVQDEKDIVEILLAQIEATPSEISESWLASVFRHVRTRGEMEGYLEGILADGARFQKVWNAEKAKQKQVPSRNPNAYVFQARDLIYARYAGGLSISKLSSRGRGLLALSLHIEHENAAEEEREVHDEVLTTFFRESSALYSTIQQAATDNDQDPRPWMEEHTRLLEVAIVNRHLLIRDLKAAARQQYSGTHVSAGPARVRISGWEKALSAHLMDLGRLYIDAATGETTYKQKQQEAAESGFRALAMVYRKTQSPEALRVLREANRIQRYNLWQMARVAWKAASEAARAGQIEAADSGYFKSKMLYLECLSRLEQSKKPRVAADLAELQEEISAWMRDRAAPSDE